MSLNNRVNILGDVGLTGSLIMLQNNESFPANPALGTMVIKDYGLYAYVQVGELQTWYPFNNNKTKSYIHTQSIASSRWTINHNLNSTDLWFQVYSTTGVPVFASRSEITANSFKLDLVEATTGTVIVVSPDTIDVPYVKAQSFTVGEGTDNVTVIDNSGIRVNGEYVLTSGTVQPASADLTAIDALTGNSGFLKKTGLNTWALDNITFATVATSGSYNDLSDKPQLVASFSDITNKPTTLSGYGITDAVSSSLLAVANGVATLDSTGKIPSGQLPSYVDDVVEYTSLAGFPATGETGKIYVDKATNLTYRWSGSTYVQVGGSSVADAALKLNTARTISATGDASWSVSFDGSDNATAALTLANSGVSAGTYNSVTVDAKGRVTAGSTSLTSVTLNGITTQGGAIVSTIKAVSALDIDCSTGNYFTKTISGDSTFTFSNAPNSVAYSFTLRVNQSAGTYTTGITWPTSVTWPGNNAPSLTAGKTHMFVFVTENGGATWRGAALTNYTT